MRRVLLATHSCYLDDSNGASVASRAAMEALARAGFAVEALTSTALELHMDVDPAWWLAQRGISFQISGSSAVSVDARGLRSDLPPHFRLTAHNVPVTLHQGSFVRSATGYAAECVEFLTLYEAVLNRFRPDVVVNYGGDLLADQIRAVARARGIVVVFALHNFNYRGETPFHTADAVTVPSQFAADQYRRSLGLDCKVLPNIVDFDRVRVATHRRDYLTFVNPSYEKGVYAFARIADELGRRRPDIPLLVVEGRGSERTLADCGLDLRVHGNVNLMSNTSDPREFWGVTRLCLLPSLWWESQGLVAVEAMINGIPVIGSNRGGIPETLGHSGVVLPLPEWLTPSTRELPSAEDVARWVETIIQIWDDTEEYDRLALRSLDEAERWSPAVLEREYSDYFRDVRIREQLSDVLAPERRDRAGDEVRAEPSKRPR